MYGSVSGLESHIPSIGAVGGSSTPDTKQVASWLEQASSFIDRKIALAGYTVPVDSSSVIYNELVLLNNMYAAAIALQALGLDSVVGDNELKSQVMMSHVHEHLDDIVSQDLSNVGVPLNPSTSSTSGIGLQTVQMRRIDGFSKHNEESEETEDFDYPGV